MKRERLHHQWRDLVAPEQLDMKAPSQYCPAPSRTVCQVLATTPQDG
jgi:hypothetical protein